LVPPAWREREKSEGKAQQQGKEREEIRREIAIVSVDNISSISFIY